MDSSDGFIVIDGSQGEGGGQIVRTALALSVVTGKAIHVVNIRQGRKAPGLKRQHLKAIEVLKEMCNAKTNNVDVGSTELEFSPGKIVKRKFEVDIGTAGSITLLLQSLWLPMIMDGGRFRMRFVGGTDVAWSMPIDYLREVFVPQIRRFADVEITTLRRGFYPKGGGTVDLVVKKKEDLGRMELVGKATLMHIKGVSYATRTLEGAEVAERMAKAAESKLARLGVPINLRIEYCESDSDGCGIVLWGILSRDGDEVDINDPLRIGGDALGERGKKSEIVGEEAAEKLLLGLESGKVVDEWLADNLVPFIGVFGGKAEASKITEHVKSNVTAVNSMLGKVVEIKENLIWSVRSD